MLPKKIKNWVENKFFPQRCLMSGRKSSNLFAMAIAVASHLQDTPEEKLKKETCPDTLILSDDGKTIGIGEKENPEKKTVRGLIVWCQQKPVKSHRIVILENFERVTPQAYNALLKILEEPPERVIFIFTTQNHYRILPTILSRMTVVRIPTTEILEKEIPDLAEYQRFLAREQGLWKFKKIEDLVKQGQKEKSGKNLILNFLENLLLLSQQSPQYYCFLEVLLQARVAVNRNQNQRLVMERLVLQIEKFFP